MMVHYYQKFIVPGLSNEKNGVAINFSGENLERSEFFREDRSELSLGLLIFSCPLVSI